MKKKKIRDLAYQRLRELTLLSSPTIAMLQAGVSVCAGTCIRYKDTFTHRSRSGRYKHRDTFALQLFECTAVCLFAFCFYGFGKNLLQLAAVKVADLLRIFKILFSELASVEFSVQWL